MVSPEPTFKLNLSLLLLYIVNYEPALTHMLVFESEELQNKG